MSEPRQFPTLDRGQQFFLLAYFLLDGSSHKLVGLLFFPGDSEQATEAFHFEGFNPLLKFSRKCPALASIKGNGEDE